MSHHDAARAYRWIADVAERLPPAAIPTTTLSAGGDASAPSLLVMPDVLAALVEREGLPLRIVPWSGPQGGTRRHCLYRGVEVWAVVTP